MKFLNLKQTIALIALMLVTPQMVEAKGAKKKSGSDSNAAREKIISREGRSRSGDKSKVDFEDAEIGGARKSPMASMLNNTKAKKDYDMVPIRTDWKPEMVQSASSLDAGRTR